MSQKLILVTGSDGQLGNELKRIASSTVNFRFIFTDVAHLDITNKTEVHSFFQKHNPDIIINCAAYTAVDKAESEKEQAFAINATGAENLSIEAKKHNSLLVHVSTDYVFNGESHIPIKETTPVSPQSVYGCSKAEGEKNIIAIGGRSIIIRTSWLYSVFGNNFVKTILRLASERSDLNIVSDQIGAPTNAKDLANAIIAILQNYNDSSEKTQFLHFSNAGVASWFDFAYEIIHMSQLQCRVHPIATTDYPLPAKRPHYSLLDLNKIKTNYNIQPRHWKDALADCLNEINTKL
jgi:dTDP-4-dehydrorhamnose reductase